MLTFNMIKEHLLFKITIFSDHNHTNSKNFITNGFIIIISNMVFNWEILVLQWGFLCMTARAFGIEAKYKIVQHSMNSPPNSQIPLQIPLQK